MTLNPPVARRARSPRPPVVGPKGELYVLYLDLGEDVLDYEGGHRGRGGAPYPGRWQLVMARSTDRGATWKESLVDDEIVPTERFIAFTPPFPSLAVDPRTEHAVRRRSTTAAAATPTSTSGRWPRAAAPGAPRSA